MLLKNALESFETYSWEAPSILSCLQTKNDIVTNNGHYTFDALIVAHFLSRILETKVWIKAIEIPTPILSDF